MAREGATLVPPHRESALEITITARKTTLDDTIRQYIESKLHRHEGLLDRIISVQVVVEDDHGKNCVEFIAKAPQNHTFTARAEDPDLRKAIDGAEQRLEAQVRHWKDKLVDHRS